MGRIVSDTDWSTRLTVDGVLLGTSATRDEPPRFAWDDPRLPDGMIDQDGNVLIEPPID